MVLSLHKQPLVTAYFQFITAHFVRHCPLKMPCGPLDIGSAKESYRRTPWLRSVTTLVVW